MRHLGLRNEVQWSVLSVTVLGMLQGIRLSVCQRMMTKYLPALYLSLCVHPREAIYAGETTTVSCVYYSSFYHLYPCFMCSCFVDKTMKDLEMLYTI